MGIELLAAGTLISAYGAISKGQAEADAAHQKADSLNLQAQEVMRRNAINVESIKNEGESFLGKEASAELAGGVQLSGSALTNLISTRAEIQRRVYNSESEAQFEVQQLKSGASAANSYADKAQSAGYTSAFGGLLMSGASYASGTGMFAKKDYQMGITQMNPLTNAGGGLSTFGYGPSNGSFMGNNYIMGNK